MADIRTEGDQCPYERYSALALAWQKGRMSALQAMSSTFLVNGSPAPSYELVLHWRDNVHALYPSKTAFQDVADLAAVWGAQQQTARIQQFLEDAGLAEAAEAVRERFALPTQQEQ
jgi:hypothetical protein